MSKQEKELCHYCNEKPIASGRVKYCSEDCAAMAKSIRERGKYKKANYGKSTCKICGDTFKPRRVNQITCGKRECQAEWARINKRVEAEQRMDVDDPDVKLQQLIDRERIRYKTRIERTELLRRVQRQGLMEYVLENIKDIVGSYDQLKAEPIREPVGKDYPPETFVALLSDAHVGEEVLTEDVQGLGEYNYDIFKSSLEQYAEALYEIVDIQRHAIQVDEGRLYILGDFMTNVILFIGQGNWVDLDLYDQLFLGHQALSEFIIQIASIFKKLKVVAVIGNHGRIEQKKGTQKDHVNYDYFIYKMTKNALEEKCKNVEFVIPRGFFAIDQVYNSTFFLQHGDNVDKWMNYPWYGMDRAALAYHAILGNAGTYFDYFLSAHFHQQMNVQAAFGEIISNGTLVGPNYFSIKRLKSAIKATQMIFGVNETQGITGRWWLNFKR